MAHAFRSCLLSSPWYVYKHMRVLAIVAFSLAPAFSQVAEIATNVDGSALLFRSQFRLQSETGASSQEKIYRWQSGAWSRAGIQPVGGGIIPARVYWPFVVADGSIYGWQVYPGSGLFPPIPIIAKAEVHGIALPEDFPREYLRISANGRFFVGSKLSGVPQIGGYVSVAPQLLDTRTGARTVFPEDARLPQVASDGTVVYLHGAEGAGMLAVVPVSGSTREFPSSGLVFGIAFSADAQWIAVETVAPDGQHTLSVVSAATGDSVEIATLSLTDRGRGSWSLSNNRVVYFARGEGGEITRLNVWDPITREARALAESPEPFAEVVLSADGSVAWTVTEANRLWRFEVASGAREEILPPLGDANFNQPAAARGASVPGSALLLRGKFTRGQQVFVDNEPWPTSDVNADGFWFQVPWEWRGLPDGPPRHTLTVRAQGNPFEYVTGVAYDGDYLPYFPTREARSSPDGTTVIAAHDDFRGIATESDPALGGETVHVYMTGLGALDRQVPTGEPAPIDPAHPLRPLTCTGQRIGTPDRIGLAIPFAAFASGMIGIYQVDITIPSDVPNGLWGLRCGDGNRQATGYLFTKP